MRAFWGVCVKHSILRKCVSRCCFHRCTVRVTRVQSSETCATQVSVSTAVKSVIHQVF
jgi:hypothetical protein